MYIQEDLSWLKEYEELMFGPVHTARTMARAAEIKYEHMPNILFKYRSCSPNTFEALENDFLFSSQPSEFNDIFEGAIEIVIEEAQRNIYQKAYDNLRTLNPFLADRPTHSYQDLLEIFQLVLADPIKVLDKTIHFSRLWNPWEFKQINVFLKRLAISNAT